MLLEPLFPCAVTDDGMVVLLVTVAVVGAVDNNAPLFFLPLVIPVEVDVSEVDDDGGGNV